MNETREQIIETTAELLEMQGYLGTGLNQIIKESGAPKGSLYYHFPQGKEQFTTEAVHRIAQTIEERIRTNLAAIDNPGEAVAEFILKVAHYVEATEFAKGGGITTVALESITTSERIREACKEAYDLWQAAVEAKLVQSGYEPQRAKRLAALIISSIEGAIILSRTSHSLAPMKRIAEELKLLLQSTHKS
ncbi:MAG: TetR family transcriptional regulator [Anaerolineae bacterium]|nr:TetR family transcriptional regulator [Anaerolineae bacterium]NIN95500.1 TetR family transcriptional regulator [Anaerolineae bacterium]NIQ78484.1 TetR family transcriptional regulator [Anaerolineae bacterium]